MMQRPPANGSAPQASSKAAATRSSVPLAERRVDRAVLVGRPPAASAVRARAAARPAIKARAARSGKLVTRWATAQTEPAGARRAATRATAATLARVAVTRLAARARLGRAP